MPSNNFRNCVLKIVSKIPKGSVMTYGEVTRRAGNPKAARAVGVIMSKNFDSKIPCHRVIHSDGTMGGYNRGVKKKIRLLKQEGAL